MTLVEPVKRIDSNADGVDDVAIAPVTMFRLERMTDTGFWCAVYTDETLEKREVFWIGIEDGKIKVIHETD